MNHKEYIIPIGEEAKEFDEIFIGVIRKQPELIRCKDCKYYEEQDETIGTCLLTESGAHIEGYCVWAERKEE
jgi:hypothetical protein